MRRLLALAVLPLLLAVACSDDGSSDAGEKTTSTTGSSSPSSTAGLSKPTDTAPVPSEGCGAATEASSAAKQTVDVNGTERFYLQSAPARTADDDPMPLVVDIHGLAEGAQIATAMSKFGELGQQEGFAAVFPNGTGSPLRWDLDLDPQKNPDMQYLNAMLDQVEQQLCIDTSRVYATGLSMGAMMSSAVGCVMSDRFAAIAPVAGVRYYEACDPPRAVPVLAFHGTKDPILLYDGGVDTGPISGILGGGDDKGASTTTTTTAPANKAMVQSYPEAAQAWADHNGCTGKSDERVSDEVVHRTFDCPDGSDVEFYIVEGGGHTWPGSEFSKSIEKIVGHTTFDIDATKLIWEFLQQFRLPAGSN